MVIMDDLAIKSMIKRHEGFRDYIYLDTVGVPTGGYGHAFLEGSPFPRDVAELIFNHDFANAVRDYNSLGLELDDVRRGVVVDMLFNLGLTKLRKFRRTLAHLAAKDWEGAASSMEQSRWYGQVGNRSKELVEMIRSGKYEGRK